MTQRVHHQRHRDEQGFTLIEVLVVVLIVGVLAAIAIPAFLNQTTKANDSAAKAQVRSAATAMETCATDNGGSYQSCEALKLTAIEPTLNDAKVAKLTVKTAVAGAYEITSESVTTKDRFKIKRTAGKAVERLCEPASSTEKSGCPSGSPGAPGSW